MFAVSPFTLMAASRLFHSPAIDELQEATEADTTRVGTKAVPCPGAEVIQLPSGIANHMRKRAVGEPGTVDQHPILKHPRQVAASALSGSRAHGYRPSD
ncbi:MAG: hypothetical protein JXJ18_06305 [Rhodobacteraceae bacterium]|nr:hypothetical protein [Paracoccaceae bacterium]